MSTDTVLMSPFFHKVWTVMTGLTITDSLFAQALNIGVLQVVVSNEDDACNRTLKLLSLLLYPTNTITKTYISLETSYLT